MFKPLLVSFKNRVLSSVTSRLDHVLASQGHTFAVNHNLLERNLYLTGQIASKNVRSMKKLNSLADAEFRVTSQWGEDGIIDWLIEQLPNINPSFIEFGVENFAEANCRFLLQNRGFRGLVLDGTEANISQLRSETIHWMHDINPITAFITAENINQLIVDNGFSGELGILSVDLDGNDYWILKAIDCVNPSILIAEFNGVFGDQQAFTVPYDPTFERFSKHHSGQYFGASLQAMISLASERGFSFVGTNSNGVNAFFIREDLADKVLPKIKKIRSYPALHRDSRGNQGELNYVRGIQKTSQIQYMPIIDLADNKEKPISSVGDLYSDDWKTILGV